MYAICKDFHISVSHVLDGLPEGHPCGRVHGHNVVVRVSLVALDLDRHGFVLDYGDLNPLRYWLDKTLDHRHLNDVVGFQPSAENMARFVFDHVVTAWTWPIYRVGWSETPGTWATYEP